MLHYLILIPYYFFGALTLTAFLVVTCRLLALPVPIAYVVGGGVLGTVIGLILTLATYHISIEHFGLVPLLVLFASSLVLATVDAILQRWRKIPLDDELSAL